VSLLESLAKALEEHLKHLDNSCETTCASRDHTAVGVAEGVLLDTTFRAGMSTSLSDALAAYRHQRYGVDHDELRVRRAERSFAGSLVDRMLDPREAAIHDLAVALVESRMPDLYEEES
jgi:hypothetical protein